MENKVSATIAQYAMLERQDTVLVGLSGGADSICLLHVLLALSAAKEYAFTVHCCHINHMLRGEQSDADEAFVRDLCSAKGVPLHVLRKDVAMLAKERGIGLEECGRAVRYRYFGEVAATLDAKIATAHTLSDSAETVLLNLTRGTALKGLCGIPPVRGRIIRPLIACTRQEVEAYLTERGIAYVTDESNLSAVYTRNKLRHEVIPVLLSINPSLLQGIARMTQSLTADSDYLEEQAKSAYTAAKCGALRLNLAALQADTAICSRCVRMLLEEGGVAVTGEKITAAAQIISQKSGKLKVASGKYLVVRRGIAALVTSESLKPQSPYEYPLQMGEMTLPWGERYNFQLTSRDKIPLFAKINKILSYSQLDYAKLFGNAVVRNRRSGDKIRLHGRSFTSSVKKLLNERVPIEERGRIMLLADDAGVVFMEGFGVAQRAEVDEHTALVLLIYKTQSHGA